MADRGGGGCRAPRSSGLARQEQLRLLPLLGLASGFQSRSSEPHRSGRPGRLRHLDLHEPGAVASRWRLPALGVSDGRGLILRAGDLAGRRVARTPNALLMIPCQLAAVAAIWSLRTRWSAWLAALVAALAAERYSGSSSSTSCRLRCWPSASPWRTGSGSGSRASRSASARRSSGRRRSPRSRCSCGCSRRTVPRESLRHAAGFVVAFGALTIPYLAWDADDVWAAYVDPGWPDDHRRVAAVPAAALARPGGPRRGLHPCRRSCPTGPIRR